VKILYLKKTNLAQANVLLKHKKNCAGTVHAVNARHDLPWQSRRSRFTGQFKKLCMLKKRQI
jgi:hypothetical protein